MLRSDFHYQLPADLIAQFPLDNRSDSRLLCLAAGDGRVTDRMFVDLPAQLQPGDLLVFNDTRVIPARLFGRKLSGGRVELLIERVTSPTTALAHIRASKSPRPGSELLLDGGGQLRVTGRQGGLFGIDSGDLELMPLLQQQGHMPLPPYITRDDKALDLERYQTVFAQRPGAVAAPTAGLHFDRQMLDRLQQMGVNSTWVTLHVGAGTFQPVRAERLEEHQMHSEYLEVSQATCDAVTDTRAAGGRVVAIGTTSVRCLETASAAGVLQPFQGETQLFITPGYRFRSVDAMLTNFHLPESTLLMLVSAFAGHQQIMAAYRHAVAAGYRFFSYGDAMFLSGQKKCATRGCRA